MRVNGPRRARCLLRATGSRRRRICCGRFITKWISSSTTEAIMFNESKFRQFVKKNPHSHIPFYARLGSRRDFFRTLGAAGLAALPLGAQVVKSQDVQTKNTAK